MPKISQMQTGEHFDQLCDLIDIIDEIVSDKEFVRTFTQMFNVKDLTNEKAMKHLWDNKSKVIKVILRDKRTQLLKAYSILSDKSLDEINAQPIMETIAEVYTSFNDKDLVAFIKSQVKSK